VAFTWHHSYRLTLLSRGSLDLLLGMPRKRHHNRTTRHTTQRLAMPLSSYRTQPTTSLRLPVRVLPETIEYSSTPANTPLSTRERILLDQIQLTLSCSTIPNNHHGQSWQQYMMPGCQQRVTKRLPFNQEEVPQCRCCHLHVHTAADPLSIPGN